MKKYKIYILNENDNVNYGFMRIIHNVKEVFMYILTQTVFYSIVTILVFTTCNLHAQQVTSRDILEQKSGAKIDTFYYANYADAVNEIDFDHGLEPKDCFQGIMVLQYKGIGKWDIYEYDFTSLFSSILHESKTGEVSDNAVSENYGNTDNNTMIEQINKRLKELTINDIVEHIDINTFMFSTNSKPQLVATIHSPYDHSMYVKNNGKYQTIGSKYPYNFTINQVEVSIPSNEKNGFVHDKSCSKIIHISDTLVNSGREIASYPLAGIWFIDNSDQHQFLSHQKSFSYILKTGEKVEKYYNLGLCFIAKLKDVNNREYLVLFSENGRKELSVQYRAMIHNNQYMFSGDGGNGYERSQFAVISDEKEAYVLDTESGTMIKVPKGHKPDNIDNVIASFPDLSYNLSDYLGRYPIFKKLHKYYFSNGEEYIEITKKYLKSLPSNQ